MSMHLLPSKADMVAKRLPSYRDYADWKRRAPVGLDTTSTVAKDMLATIAYLRKGESYAELTAHWLDLGAQWSKWGVPEDQLWPYFRGAIHAVRRFKELDEVIAVANRILSSGDATHTAVIHLASERKTVGSLYALETALKVWDANREREGRTANDRTARFHLKLTDILGSPCSGKSTGIMLAAKLRGYKVMVHEGSLLTPESLFDMLEALYKQRRSVVGDRHKPTVLVFERAQRMTAVARDAITAYAKGKMIVPLGRSSFRRLEQVEIVMENSR